MQKKLHCTKMWSIMNGFYSILPHKLLGFRPIPCMCPSMGYHFTLPIVQPPRQQCPPSSHAGDALAVHLYQHKWRLTARSASVFHCSKRGDLFSLAVHLYHQVLDLGVFSRSSIYLRVSLGGRDGKTLTPR